MVFGPALDQLRRQGVECFLAQLGVKNGGRLIVGDRQTQQITQQRQGDAPVRIYFLDNSANLGYVVIGPSYRVFGVSWIIN